MKKIILAMAAVIPLLGCGGRNEETLVFDKVEIERLLPQNVKGKTTITNREAAAKLAAFFSEMGRGKNSDIAGGWKAAYRLRFIPAKGDPIKITVDSKGELWSEGRGDWKAEAGLKEYLDGLLRKDNEKQAKEEWSDPVNGLRGRLVRYAPPLWMLKPGKYTLRGTFTVRPAAGDNHVKKAWKGRLDLPPLEIEVH